MAEDKNEEKRPGEPAWVTDPEFQKQMMFHLYLQASDEGRALMAPLFEQFGLPLPFIVAQPPDLVTPKMAIAALTQLLQQSAMHNARKCAGVTGSEPDRPGAWDTNGHWLLSGPQRLPRPAQGYH